MGKGRGSETAARGDGAPSARVMTEAQGCTSVCAETRQGEAGNSPRLSSSWVKAFEEWVSFPPPSSLYLELKKTRDPPLQTRTKVSENSYFVLGRFEGTKLLIPSAPFTTEHHFISPSTHHQFRGVSSLSPCCPVSPEKPSGKQGCGVPSSLRHGWRDQDLVFMGIAVPRLSASPRSITTSRDWVLDQLPLATFTTQGLLTWRNLSSRDILASFNRAAQRPSQVDIIISILLKETVKPKPGR